jgi:hypothetical protein
VKSRVRGIGAWLPASMRICADPAASTGETPEAMNPVTSN